MAMDKVSTEALLTAGLEVMERCGKPLTRRATRGRAQIFEMSGGQTVRVRTSNDHQLVTRATDPNPEVAQLGFEDTDYVLVIMPAEERKPGPAIAYLVPGREAERQILAAHRQWLAMHPNTHGNNRTFCIWFGNNGPSTSNRFADRWAEYRLPGSAVTAAGRALTIAPESRRSKFLAEVIAVAKRNIATAAGVPLDAVKISIDL